MALRISVSFLLSIAAVVMAPANMAQAEPSASDKAAARGLHRRGPIYLQRAPSRSEAFARKAIRLHPLPLYYVDLCAALKYQAKTGDALAACKHAVRNAKDPRVAKTARELIATINNESRNATTPAQAGPLHKLYLLTQRLHFHRDKAALAHTCLNNVANVVRLGVTLDRQIKVYPHHLLVSKERYVPRKGRMYFAPLRDVRTMCKQLTSIGKQSLQRVLEPFRRVLQGGKIKTFERHQLYALHTFGLNQQRLRSPRDFEGAAVWFQLVTHSNGCGASTCWRLRRFEFRGHRLRFTKDTTGKGSAPPRQSFR